MVRSESQLVIPLLETGSESAAQPQPQPQPQPQQQQQQQQFESEENRMVLVVKACRDMMEIETRGEEQKELAAATEAAAAAATSGGTIPCLDVTARTPTT